MQVFSLVEGEHPVREAKPEANNTINTPESTMLFVDPTQKGLMSTIAEWGIGTHLAIAELVVAGFSNIESYWSASCHNPLALTITKRRVLSVTARTPVINLATMEVHVSREETSKGGKRGRTVFAFFIWSRLIKHDNLLQREISNIIHCDLGTRSVGL